MSKIYFRSRTTDPAETFRKPISRTGKTTVKISAQNHESIESYTSIRGQKVAVFVSQISQLNLMI
jgi:hypothetical protein